MPPVKPMLAKAVGEELPEADGLIFEPKWDGFRCLVFRDGDEISLQSRNLRPFERYVPELVGPLRDQIPTRCVLDGELVVITGDELDFGALQQRIHPAKSRIDLLASRTPTSYVAFDLLALGDDDLRSEPFVRRRELLVGALGAASPPVHLTPATTDRGLAAEWFTRFEGAGIEGLVAKPPELAYAEGRRVQFKVKHQRSADCVPAGYRMHKDGKGVGSLLLGVYDPKGHLNHLGVATSFTARRRVELLDEVRPLLMDADELDEHPWSGWAVPEAHEGGTRLPGAPNRWSGGRDASWVPLRPVAVVEVAYDSLQDGRFRHATRMLRWRIDRTPESCTFEQFETPTPVPLGEVLSGGAPDP